MSSRPTAALLAACLALGSVAAAADDVARGDLAWARRAEGERAGRPRPEAIAEAVYAYAAAVAAAPRDLAARWKLLRALHFEADFVVEEVGARRAILDRGREVGEEALAELAARAGDGTRLDELPVASLASRSVAAGLRSEDVARLYFWSAIHLGAWSQVHGLVSAVREGVANRLYRYTQVTLALEPGYDEGGAYRLLGRLHARLPRLPVLSSWVDRTSAIPTLEKAHALAPENPGNRLLLALTLLELAADRRAEAVALLRQVAELTPRATMRIEDLTMREQALRELAKQGERPSD